MNLEMSTGNNLEIKTLNDVISSEHIQDIHVRNDDVQIRQITGSLTLTSSNGDIQVGVADSQHIQINASNGDVTLSAPEKFSATLDLAEKTGFEWMGAIQS